MRRTVLCERFLAGFERRLRAIAFRLARYREDFIRFAPPIPARYRFPEKGAFVVRSLVWQAAHLDVCRDLFLRYVNSRKSC